jgi:hypothetical protein
LHAPPALNEQARPRQQHERHGNFRYRQRMAPPAQ